MHLNDNVKLQEGILGGLIIGASSTALYYYTGKVSGMSGIVGRTLVNNGDKESCAISYLAGLLSSGALLVHIYPDAFGSNPLMLSPFGYAAAGLFTGFGTRMGSGCTSGHGICGLPRRSVRSLVAVLTFMSTGAISSYLAMNTSLKDILRGDNSSDVTFQIAPTVITAIVGAALLNRNFLLHKAIFGTGKVTDSALASQPGTSVTEHAISFTSAVVFGLGLGISGMCNPDRVTNFLNFSGAAGWDPTLMGVMGGGVLFNLISFHLMSKSDHVVPLDSKKKISSVLKMDAHPDNLKIDWRLVTGSALFGIGWGLGGMCPGPALVSLGASVRAAGLFLPYLLLGMISHEGLRRIM